MWMSSDCAALNQATAKLATRLQWNSRTSGSQTATALRPPPASPGACGSVLTGFGIVDLDQRLGVEGLVDLLAILVDGIDLVAAVLDLDAADGEARGLELAFQRRLGLELRRGACAA